MLRLPQSALQLRKRAVDPTRRPGSAPPPRGAYRMRMARIRASAAWASALALPMPLEPSVSTAA